jgi:hypothetical protein
MASTCARAQRLLRDDPATGAHAVRVADLFCRQSRERVKVKFHGLWRNEDVPTYNIAQEVLRGEHTWLEKGMVELQS